ncbi:hypothetical protein D3C75_241750 [compost metagenome]
MINATVERSEEVMKTYDIVRIDNMEYPYCIISTSYETPLTNLSQLTQDLSAYSSGFKVIFDFLLCSGNSTERFYEAFFDGEHFKENSFRIINLDKKSELRKLSCNHLNQHKEYLDQSVLNNFQKKMLEKGITI